MYYCWFPVGGSHRLGTTLRPFLTYKESLIIYCLVILKTIKNVFHCFRQNQQLFNHTVRTRNR